MGLDVAVAIRGLTKVIGSKAIVDDLSFDIRKGEVFGLLGPNGAGKTTTIRMIVGLISMTKGSVSICGMDVTKRFTAAMQHVGAIVENPEMYNFMSGYQNLTHFANMSDGVSRARIDEIVKQVGLEKRIHDKVKTYSLGMRQRLGLAQALLKKPDVIILDEPTNGLDPAGIRELRDYLRGLAHTQQISVIVSSHLLSEMELMCDRVAIIQSGKLIDIRAIRNDHTDEATEQSFVFEVDSLDTDTSEQVFSSMLSNSFQRFEDKFEVRVARMMVPALVQQLTRAGVRIYGVRAVSKTLEDTFLEMTGGGANVETRP